MSTSQTNSLLIRLFRFCRLFLHFLLGLTTTGLLFPVYSQQQRDRAIVQWARKLLAILHVRVEVRGDVALRHTAGCIIAANHISWLDIFLIHTIRPARFVAKSEIRDWPVVGWLCAKTGTLFIERTRRHHTAKINEIMRDVVQEGGTVGLFPEGSTSLGDQLKKLHSSLFQAAVQSDVPLIPTAIRYTDIQRRRSEIPAYVDDMSLAKSLSQILAAPELCATLHFATPIIPTGKNRRELTQETENAIASLLHQAE
ncbi:MAG: lysophospholipid acyltransferase family protein [Pseudomonadota bacterium]